MQRLLLLVRPRRRPLTLPLWVALLAFGCGGEAGSDGATNDAEAADGARAAIDGGGGTDSTDDADGATASDAGPVVACATPKFELGSNETGKATPKDFVPISDGGKMEVVKGPQGLWMVVLAFRTCGLYTPPLVLRARIETADKAAQGKLDVAKQKLNPSGDGLQYYYNFWLVVDKPEAADGKQAAIDFTVEDAKGKVGKHSLQVQLARVCRDAAGVVVPCQGG